VIPNLNRGLPGTIGHPPPATAGLVHQALLYGSEREFLEGALPFVEEGIERSEPVLAAVQASNVEALRRELGPDADGVALRSVEEWYENSARTRAKFAGWVSARQSEGAHRVRLIGEPPWPLASEAGVRDWARHEAVINVALAGAPLTFICPYDARALPAAIIDHAECTHPEILHGADLARSNRYAEAEEFCDRLNEEIGPGSDAPAAVLWFEGGDLASVRRLVEQEAALVGLSNERAGDLVVAVSEVAANAVAHGGDAAAIRMYREPGELICRISDAGSGLADPLAGQLPPDLDLPGGWGLWMARLMADALEIASNGSGTVVSIHCTLEE
jgi:anti-sigma regulatory factor (Ser/Thr protein kinase)